MSRNWIPQADADFNDFINNFANHIQATPTDYGLVAGDGVAIDATRDLWVTAYNLTVDPATSTATNRANKRTQRAATTAIVRAMAVRVRDNPAVTDANKLELGIVVRDGVPTRVPPPTTAPIISLIAPGIGEHFLRVRDTSTPTTNARPAGAAGYEVWMGTGPLALTDVADAAYQRIGTKPIYRQSFDVADDKTKATYFVRWVTRTGLVGPFSAPLSLTIGF